MIAVLTDHLVMGVCFAALVVFIFLRDVRSTLIISAAIPVSLLGAMIVMFAQGYTLNTMTMLSLLLLIGVVVDDAIVVLENIYRRMDDKGEKPLVAAFAGTRQVGFAVIATTVVLVSVFVPISFLQGDVGRLFSEFALTMAAAVFLSSFAALSLAPMLASKILVPKKQ